ncbi:MAG TPA: DUF222 domain-containing protein, partial [Acidimicrobiales bacterium]|nr:DUF222 domain-containing protein [Acidimicrobiales bacterium]
MVSPELMEAGEVVGRLAGRDPAELADAESQLYLEHVRRQLESVVVRSAGACEKAEVHVADGARGLAPWLSVTCSLPRREAKARVGMARTLTHLPATEAALAAGEIGVAQAKLLCHLRNPRTEEALARDEEMLVTQAKDLRFSEFERVCRYWENHADQDGAEEKELARQASRDVTLVESYGMFFGRIALDTIRGTIVGNELSRIEDDLYADDRREAKARLGRDPLPGELRRTAAQRRADALVEMARRSAACPLDAPRTAPLFTVLVGLPELSGRVLELANGTVLTPGALLPYLEEAMIERAVFTPKNRVEISQRTRLFSGATRRAVEVRDRRCQHPYCEESAERCQVDHIVRFSDGGLTTQEN